MARTRSNKDRRLCGGEDRLSALPDDPLRLVLSRLGTRDALATAVLSRHWAGLQSELPALDFRVTDLLPPRYRRCHAIREDARKMRLPSAIEDRFMLEAIIRRYERRAMRAMVASVKALLAGRTRRHASRLSLEVFDYDTSASINQLVVTAVDSWGIKDLEVSATPTGPIAHPPPVYSFPHGCISCNPGASRLQRLKLSNCLPPPLEGFHSLTTLALQGLPYSTPAAVYQGVVAACPQLQVLQISSCMSRELLTLDAPLSRIRELLVDGQFMSIVINSLPMLESLASTEKLVCLVHSDSAPCLQRVSLAHSIGSLQGDNLSPRIERRRLGFLVPRIKEFFQEASGITDLVLRFTGPDMWIVPTSPFTPMMHNLRRLLVADVPPSWDASWPRLLVEAAPLLETLHVYYDSRHSDREVPGKETVEIPWPSSASRHGHLKELVVVGFQRTERLHVQLVRFAVEASTTALRRVALHKRGHVEHRGPGVWELATQPCAWSDEERRGVLEQIMEGICYSIGQVEVILG